MSFLDSFRKPKYAADFKKAYENNNFSDMASILMKWVDDNDGDANFSLAMVIFMDNSDKKHEEMDKMWTRAQLQKPKDKKLHEWYLDTARRIVKKWDNNSSGGSGNNYAREFLDCFNKFDDVSESEQEDLFNKMNRIVSEWGDKYPDDANYTCAYVIMNVMELDKGKLAELMVKANNQEPVDKECHVELLANMTKYAMMRNGDDDMAGVVDDLMSGGTGSGSGDKGYAKDFLDCMDKFNVISDYSEQEKLHKKMMDIVDKWEDDFPDDANFTCAYIIMNVMDFSGEKITELLLKLKNQTPIDENRHERLNDEMHSLIRMRENEGEGVIETNVVEDSSSSFDGPDGGLAKEFLDCLNKFDEVTDSDEQERLFNRMTEIVDKWEDKYPDDANYTCAYTILHIMDLSQSEAIERMSKVATQTAVDDDVHGELFAAMAKMVVEKGSSSSDESSGSGSSTNTGSSPSSDVSSSTGDDGYAKEFLDCYKKFDDLTDFDEQMKVHEKMTDILDKWGKKYPDDANYTCAYIMMNIVEFSPEKISELIDKAKSQTPIDKDVHDELYMAMDILAGKRLEDNSAEESPQQSNDSSQSTDSNKFSSLGCSEFAKEFIERFDKVREGDTQALEEMQEIVDAWEKKCPDDSNFTCAYIMMNIDSLEGSEISTLVDKINDQTPVDADSFTFMLTNMMGLVNFKNENS